LSQLKKLNQFISRRRALAKKYDEAFADLKTCRPTQVEGRDYSANHLYVLRVDFKRLGITRPILMKILKEKGVGSQVHYIPVPMQPYYRKQGSNVKNFPNSLNYYEEALSIPLFYNLTNLEQLSIIKIFRELLY